MSGGASGGRGGRGGRGYRADMSQPREHIRRGPGLGIQPSVMGRSNTSSSSSSAANSSSHGAANEQNRDDSEDGSGADATYVQPADDGDDEEDDPEGEEEEEDEEEGGEGEQEGVARPAKKRPRAAAGGGRKVQRRLQARGTPENLSNAVLMARLQAYEKGYRALTAATSPSSSASASIGDGSSPSACGSSLGIEKKRLKNEKLLIHCFPPDVLLKGVDVLATELASEIWKTVRFSTPFLEDEAALYCCAEELYPTVMESLGRSVTDLPFTLFWNPPVAASKIQGIKGGKSYVYRKVRDKRISKLQILVGCRFPCTSI